MTITTDPDYLALLRNVLHAPHDDLPRLVLADWLEEPERAGSVPCGACKGQVLATDLDTGEACAWCLTCNGMGYVSNGNAGRAEFIRLEIALSQFNQIKCEVNARPEKYPYGCGKCDFCRIQIACEDFHDTPSKWSQIFHDLPFGYAHTSRHPESFSYDPFPAIFTRRGLVGSIRLTAEQFMQHAEALFREHPITEVVLSDVQAVETTTSFGTYWLFEYETIPEFIRGEREFGPLSDEMGMGYETYEAFAAALSRACVRVGRRLAELSEEYTQ